mgnify:CR=1 FL=1
MEKKPVKKNRISLKKAQKWATEWRDDEASYNKYFNCRAFTIPLEDLKEVITEGAVSVRGYLGVKKSEDKETGKTIFEEKLMFVGVDKNGKDMISSSDGETLDAENGDIFDATQPCPDSCDFSSPLMK